MSGGALVLRRLRPLRDNDFQPAKMPPKWGVPESISIAAAKHDRP